MPEVTIPSVEDFGDVYCLDTQHIGNEGTVCAYLVPGNGEGFALVETGPGSTLPTIKRAIDEAGFDLTNLAAVFVTHIHLDHAGAAGTLAKETGATVYVHDIGAPHLLDPSRLMSSATRIYGEQMDRLWGTMQPVPEAQLRALSGGETVEAVGRSFRVLCTPGHASHHVAYQLDDGSMFTGDVAAIHLRGSTVIRPPLPPPEIDLETWDKSIEKLLEAQPTRLLLTHFGEVKDAEAHLRAVPGRNRAWANVILEGLQQGESNEELVARIAAYGDAELEADNAPPEVIARHRATSNYEMTVTGAVRYWKKHYPEKLEGY